MSKYRELTVEELYRIFKRVPRVPGSRHPAKRLDLKPEHDPYYINQAKAKIKNRHIHWPDADQVCRICHKELY